MDALQEARNILEVTTRHTGLDGEALTWIFAQAHAYAAIAQAEAAQRQAAALESIANTLKDDYITVAKKEW